MTTPNLIVQQITEKMKCSTCNEFLRPPIWYTRSNTNICSGCKENNHQTIVGKNEHLEEIGELLKFPCTYKTFGCKSLITWAEASLHESECPLRQFTCPSCMTWKGSADNMKDHVLQNHPSKLFNKSCTLSLLSNENVIYVHTMGELYVLLYKCDTDAGLLWFTLKSVGPLERAKRRYYKVSLERNECAYCEKRRVESAKNWEIDEDSAIKIDLCVLRMKLQLRNENVIQLCVDVCARTPLYNGSVDEDLLRDIECLVCQEYMSAPIRQCVTGHSLCNYCLPRLNSCPLCKAKLCESRNFSLESVCSKMFYKCMFAEEGCDYATLPQDIFSHEDECDFGLADCPLKSFISHCNWRGKLTQISSHTLEEHGWKF